MHTLIVIIDNLNIEKTISLGEKGNFMLKRSVSHVNESEFVQHKRALLITHSYATMYDFDRYELESA